MVLYAEEEGSGEEAEEEKKAEPGQFVGVCDACGRDVNEGEEALCPHCGAVFHNTCVKKVCKRCKTKF